MMHHDDMHQEIGRNEAWLAARLVDAAPDAEAIRTRIRVELNEQWLAERMTTPTSAELAQRLRSGIRAELARLYAAEVSGATAVARVRTVDSPRQFRGLRPALAAAAALVFLIAWSAPFSGARWASAGHRAAPAYEVLLASLAAPQWEGEAALAAVRADVDMFESSLAGQGSVNVEDAVYRCVGEEMDRLLDEIDAEMDAG